MGTRLELHDELCAILGSSNVYFQPPASVLMKYDAIRYELSEKNIKRANDRIYSITNQYDLVYITTNPESTIPDEILRHFQLCRFGSPYTKDNLYHYPFTLFY